MSFAVRFLVFPRYEPHPAKISGCGTRRGAAIGGFFGVLIRKMTRIASRIDFWCSHVTNRTLQKSQGAAPSVLQYSWSDIFGVKLALSV